MLRTMSLLQQLRFINTSIVPPLPITTPKSKLTHFKFMSSTKDPNLVSSTEPEVAHEFPFFRVYKDRRVQKFRWPPTILPPSDDDFVKSKDVVISTRPEITARIFLPRVAEHPPGQKLPVLLYVHGGGFSFESAFSTETDRYVRLLAAKANAVAVSVEYRLAPENPIPACYDDCWTALQWVGSHRTGTGPDPWLNRYADFNRLFLAGESAGANICHTLAVRVGSNNPPDPRVVGVVLSHPYFGGTDDDEMWLYMCPDNSGLYDRRLRPAVDDLEMLGCDRVLVSVAEKDHLCKIGRAYYEDLMKSGWKGTVEIVESLGEGHCFHMEDPTCDKAVVLINKIVDFINKD